MMMMPFVMDDGILVTESEKPGYVLVVGGPLKKLIGDDIRTSRNIQGESHS